MAMRRVRGVLAAMMTTALVAAGAVPAQARDPLPRVTVTEPCRGVVSFPAAERAELIELSDPGTLRDLADGRDRMERITDLLVGRDDRRGIFAVFYRNILREAVPALADTASFEDPAWATAASEEFFVRYLAGLNASLRGRTIPSAWRTYYRQAADCSVPPGRVAMAGLDAHLILDFPDSLAAAGTTKANFADYYAIGATLQAVTEQIGIELREVYGADLTEFFQLWFFGDKIDASVGAGTTTTLLFQGIRTVAFTYGLGLQDRWKRLGTQVAMQGTYGAAEGVSDVLAAAKVI